MVILKQSLEGRVEKIKGNNEEINSLISEYKPFIASVAQKRAGKFLKFGTDDELSIALMAFKESIDVYDRKRDKFLSFSRMVINMRLIDYYRKQGRQKESAILDKLNDYQKSENIDMESMEKYRMD